jgi:hypothetical protein
MLVIAADLRVPPLLELARACSFTFALRDTPWPPRLSPPPVSWARPWSGFVRDYGIASRPSPRRRARGVDDGPPGAPVTQARRAAARRHRVRRLSHEVGQPVSASNPQPCGQRRSGRSVLPLPRTAARPGRGRAGRAGGKNLACWCPPQLMCQANVLLLLARGPPLDQVRLALAA